MSQRLDMSLDDLIKSNSQSRGPRKRNSRGGNGLDVARGHDYGSGPVRRLPSVDSARSTPYPLPQMLQFEQMPPTGGIGAESGTKLYISNLAYDISNEDLQTLFSEVGQLRDHSVHYDKSGKSKGSAEVIYVRKSDALTAMGRFNNVLLDGKAMQINMVGMDSVPPSHPTLLHSTNSILGNDGILGRPPPPPPPTSIGAYERRWNNNSNNNNGGGSGKRGYGSHGRGEVQKNKGKVCSEDLDSELEKYHLEGLKRKEEGNK